MPAWIKVPLLGLGLIGLALLPLVVGMVVLLAWEGG